MNRASIAIVDYGLGNHASVLYALRRLGQRVSLAASEEALQDAQLLVLPGVGAFPASMCALRRRGLAEGLRRRAGEGCPVLGICLGLHLLAEASEEGGGQSRGLGLIPGRIRPFADGGWHIGWNSIECATHHPLLKRSQHASFYFNHAFQYEGPASLQLAHAGAPRPCPAVVGSGKLLGLQFHPEKSQAAGLALLADLIAGLLSDPPSDTTSERHHA